MPLSAVRSWGEAEEEGGEEGVERATGGGDGRMEKGGAVAGMMGSSLTASLRLLGF